LKTLDYKEDLIAGLKASDRKAQYRFYQTYCDAMYNICVRMMQDKIEAEDVLQQSFMDAYNNIDNFNFSATPGAWLKRITINNCINHLRKKRVTLFELKDHYEVSTEVEEPVEYNIGPIKKAISLLPEGYRIVLNLYLFEGYDHGEISEIMNISESTSKSQYSRARKKLKQIIFNNKSELFHNGK
jgi:RNA polymerase sigma-70 factor (ECF subfamily)